MSGEPSTYSDSDLDEILADKDKRIAELEAAIDKAIKHADGNGMKDWPVFRTLRKVMKS